jgi:hypothetical protein
MAKLVSEWINRVEKDDMIMMDLHITDLENEIASVTISKGFDPDVVTPQFLNDVAEDEMKNLIHTYLLEKQKYAKVMVLSEADKDRILLAWARSLPEEQRLEILLDGMN